MDNNTVAKITSEACKTFGELIKKLPPEFCEKNFGKIALGITSLFGIYIGADCFKYYVDKTASRDVLVAAIQQGQLDIQSLSTSERKKLGLPTTA